ncbi:MAG: SDR family NAD(P)-dependent oxidoreductase [Betaproteobacteria bacterium]|nr:SDR family NAD(P)-dependent oxidoreductase [Betaproteobacteria bacterium]
MGKTIVITGASAGIGRALAFAFAERGYHLGLTGRRRDALEEVRAEIGRRNVRLRVELLVVDVTDVAAVGPALGGLFKALGGADIVVVNAGANDLTRIGRGEMARELALISTNLAGAIATTNAAVEHFLERGSGQIVGISSLASLQKLPQQAAYCASKAGFSMYLDVARDELARNAITVTRIMPGFVKTDIVESLDIGKIPFAITVDQAAREMVPLIERRVASGIVPAFPWKVLRPFLGHLSARLVGRISGIPWAPAEDDSAPARSPRAPG